MSLFQLGQFRLHGGSESSYKIDCDALTDEDHDCIAYLLAKRLPPFGSVEGIPTGGLVLAEKLEPYATSGPLLIVDDVLTSGGSMITHRGERDAIGAVIFSRWTPPYWVTALFEMT